MARHSILIVEDEEDIRETLKLVLELEDYQVTTASNGREALSTLERERETDVILLDLMMPVMNGWDFARALREDPTLRHIPIIVVTAYSKRAGDIDAQAIIPKPIDLDVLLDAVKRLAAPKPATP
jgi:CheY-like chemotaxis protein